MTIDTFANPLRSFSIVIAGDNMRMVNTADLLRLRRAFAEPFCWTNQEIGEECIVVEDFRLFPACGQQVNYLIPRRREIIGIGCTRFVRPKRMVGSNVPDTELSIAGVIDGAAMNYSAWFGWLRYEHGECKDGGDHASHRLRLSSEAQG
jgi:hypothetical protein